METKRRLIYLHFISHLEIAQNISYISRGHFILKNSLFQGLNGKITDVLSDFCTPHNDK